MGMEMRYLNVCYASSEKELLGKWATIREDDERDRGEDPYNGSYAHAHLTVSTKSFNTYKEAAFFAQEADIDKGYAVAYKYGGKPGFPKTKADLELVERIRSMQLERDSFHVDILKRFLDSKSSSKKCAHCESVISKKSRKHVRSYSDTRESSSAALRLHTQATDCPACGGNLLVTDTDKKRLVSLTKRHQEAEGKHREALTAAKKNSPAWGYYIAAAVPS